MILFHIRNVRLARAKRKTFRYGSDMLRRTCSRASILRRREVATLLTGVPCETSIER